MEIKNKETLWSKDFLLACCVGLFTGICMQMLNANLTLFANDVWNSKSLGGYLNSAFNAGSIAMALFSGRLADAKGRRNCIMAAAGVYGLATLSIFFFPIPAVTLCARALQGAGKGLLTVSTAAVVADTVARSRMSEGMGLYGLGNTISMAFGPMLGLALTADKQYQRMFLICAVIYLFAGVIGSQIKYEERGERKSAPAAPVENSGEYHGLWRLIDKAALPAAVNYTIFFAGFSCVLVFSTMYARDVLMLTSLQTSLFFTVAAVTMLIARLTTGKIADRIGALPVLIPAHLLIFVMYLLLIYLAPKSYFAFLAAGAVYGFANASSMPVYNAIAVVDSPKGRNGAANAAFYFLQDSGILIASGVFGVILDRAASPVAGYRQVFFISMGVCALSLLMAVVGFNNKARAKRRERLDRTRK